MRCLRCFLVFVAVVGGLCAPGVVRADSTKEGVFTLGVHLGNADGTLMGLLSSYDTRVAAHPKAIPLLHRQFRWGIDLAKVLGLPTADLEALDRDMDGMEFWEMQQRLQPILSSYQAALGRRYNPQASNVFELGRQLTMAGGYVTRALADRPERREPWRARATGQGPMMANNITTNKLEATVSRATGFKAACDRGDTYDSLNAYLGQTLDQWTRDFRAAPPWDGGTGTGVLIVNTAGTLSRSDSLDRERRGCFARVHTVNLQAGATYVIDVTSGDGSSGPGFFDVWLRIEDASGRTLMNNDDGGSGLNARATFQPTASGTYRLVVTSYRSGATGNYTLQVRQQ